MPILPDILSAQTSRGKELFSFEFDKEWLRNNPAQSLDPDLQLYAGPQFTPKSNFGLFMDSAPDRRGRRLMQRREAIRVRKAAEALNPLKETDDHLRNHGFLLTDSGWTLSPAYDLNPNPQGNGLSLNITDTDNSLDFALAVNVASLFRVKESEANAILGKVAAAVSQWRHYAERSGICHGEPEEMQAAFRIR
jgi:hypothetical protein